MATEEPDPGRVEEARVRELLPRTWYAFFGRFGRLTAVQRQAVPPLVAGESVLVTAPTASGKTEAMVAPVLERVLADEAADGLAVLLVAPTRALTNDLARRLERPVRDAGLHLDRKTGDAPGIDEERPPTLLVTTPESVDSLLSRRPRLLRSVRTVLVDELHLLDDTSRGDHLQVLLARLERVVEGPLQRGAASATVPRPEQLRRRFLGAEARSLEVAGAGRRIIDAELDEAPRIDLAVEAVARRFAAGEGRKILLFANSRAQVEALAALLDRDPRLRSRVVAHHGSLSTDERLRVERRFLNAPSAVCVATTSLELGIDVGDVDRVVLVAPPPNVASLIQRVGRANRSEEAARVLCLHAGDFERYRFEHLLECAARGRLFDEPVPFRPTVLAQQALSLLFQNPKEWIGPEPLHARLPDEARELWSVGDCREVLERMVEREWLRDAGRGRYVPEDRALSAWRFGRMHAMIADQPELEVVDELTGRVVGRARMTGREREEAEGASMQLGGRRREVTRVRDEQVWVRSSEGMDEGRFIAREAPRYSRGLARDLARYLGMPEGAMAVEPIGDGAWRLAHFMGTLEGRLLDGLLKAQGLTKRGRGDAFFAPLDRPLERSSDEGLGRAEDLRRLAAARLSADVRGLARMLQPGPFADCVPEPMLARWVEAAVDLDGFAELLAGVSIHRVDPEADEPEPGEGG